MKKILLCIMDGVGLTKEKKYNALYNAKTHPFYRQELFLIRPDKFE